MSSPHQARGFVAPKMLELRLARRADAPGRARAACAQLADDLGRDACFRAQLACSELLTNCVRHARDELLSASLLLRLLRRGETLRVEIADPAAFEPAPPTLPDANAVSGRGLAIVDAVVDRWSGPGRSSDRIWFEVDRHSLAESAAVEASGNGKRPSAPRPTRTG